LYKQLHQLVIPNTGQEIGWVVSWRWLVQQGIHLRMSPAASPGIMNQYPPAVELAEQNIKL